MYRQLAVASRKQRSSGMQLQLWLHRYDHMCGVCCGNLQNTARLRCVHAVSSALLLNKHGGYRTRDLSGLPLRLLVERRQY